MRKLALDLIALAGLALALFGVHQIYAPAALILGGVVLFLLAVQLSRGAA